MKSSAPWKKTRSWRSCGNEYSQSTPLRSGRATPLGPGREPLGTEQPPDDCTTGPRLPGLLGSRLNRRHGQRAQAWHDQLHGWQLAAALWHRTDYRPFERHDDGPDFRRGPARLLLVPEKCRTGATRQGSFLLYPVPDSHRRAAWSGPD